MGDAIEWEQLAGSPRTRRFLGWAGVGAASGTIAVALIGALVSAVFVARSGNFLPLSLVLLFALVGGPISLLYLWPMLADSDQRPEIGLFGSDQPISWWGVGTGVLALVPFFVAMIVFGTIVFIAAFLGAFIVLVVFAAGSSSGHVDPDGVLSYHGRDVPVELVTGYRTRHVGRTVFYWLTYNEGRLTTPRFLSVPDGVAPAVESALDAGKAQSHNDQEFDQQPDRLVQAILGGSGLAFLIAGGYTGWLALTGDQTLVLGYGAVAIGGMGMLLLAGAILEA